MKVMVLEHPRLPSEKRFNDIANTPLWSCLMGGYAVSALSDAGFSTLFVDDAVTGASFAKTLEKVGEYGPDLLCVNAVYFWEKTEKLFEFLSEIKTNNFCRHINLFGFFPTLVSRQILSSIDAVDSVAVGEFEDTLVELAQALEYGQESDSISGLAMGTVFDKNPPCRPPRKDLDGFRFPKRSSLDGTVSVLASRGCYNHCSFCPVPSFYNQGRLWRGRSPENIALEIKSLIDQGATSFYFCDPNFIGPGKKGKARILRLMELIKPMKIRFGMETRPQDLDDDIMAAMVEAGFESLLMGVESGSDQVLNRIDKSSGPQQASKAIALCRKHGIDPEIGFIMFVPDSKLPDLHQNMAFLMENHLLDRLDRTANLLSHTQIVLAGTSGYQRFEKKGLLKKSGIFGFEAQVTFSDPAVEWVANLVIFACHTVLRKMADKSSPIYWKKDKGPVHEAANQYLVDLCYKLMDQAQSISDETQSQSSLVWEEKIKTELDVLSETKFCGTK